MRIYPKNRFVLGTYKRECDICGRDGLRKDMLKTWNNLVVCKDDFEVKHPRLERRNPPRRIRFIKD